MSQNQEASSEYFYEVKKGIPVEKPAGGRSARMYPFPIMEVGDSFDVPIDQRVNVATKASKQKRKYGREFTVKKINETTVRVWRIA